MKSLPKKLEEKLNIRKSTNALRSLPKDTIKKVDFISNDYHFVNWSHADLIFVHKDFKD